MDETYAADPSPGSREDRRTRATDPQADGLPEYADDESSANDEVAPREADGPDPAPLPPDRDTGPLAVDDFGTTAAEQRVGESLEQRLAREQPDVMPDAVPLDAGPGLSAEAVGESAAGQVTDDSAVLAEEPVDPHLGSPISMYDRSEPGVPDNASIGRLFKPDEGSHQDTESTEIAFDGGAAGGGATAEEAAIHQVPPEEVG
jgi:hypothetical protein